MIIKEVCSKQDIQAFLNVPIGIHRNNPNWVRPLDKDIEAVFEPKLNRAFKNVRCTRWLLLNEQKEPIGRVATFVNEKYKQQQPTGGFGFLEIIDNKQAAFFLLDHCKQWLEKQGMEAMDGPIKFGERDRWWGLLTQGYTLLFIV